MTALTEPVPVRLGPGHPVHTFHWVRDTAPYLAVAAGDATQDGQHGTVVGLGVDHDRESAARAAINEVLERQSAFRLPRAPISYGSAADFGLPGSDTGWWVTGTTTTGARRTFPLELAQFALPVRQPMTTVRADSSGMAVHVTAERAAAAAVAELAERALRRTLLSAPATGRWTRLPCPAADYARLLADRGAAVSVVPVRGGPWWACVALVRGTDPAGRTLLLGGSAAATDPARAAERSLAEVFAKAHVHGLGLPAASPLATSPAVTADRLTDWLAWWDPDTAADLPFGTAPPVREPFTDAYLLDRGCDYTDAVGLSCRQAVAPGVRPDLPAELADVGGTELFG